MHTNRWRVRLLLALIGLATHNACRQEETPEMRMLCDGVVEKIEREQGRIFITCLKGQYSFMLNLNRRLPEGPFPRTQAFEVFVREGDLLPHGALIARQHSFLQLADEHARRELKFARRGPPTAQNKEETP